MKFCYMFKHVFYNLVIIVYDCAGCITCTDCTTRASCASYFLVHHAHLQENEISQVI